MILQQHTAIFLAILAISLIEAHASIKFRCNRTCGTNNLPYPFGFSADCDIHLNCSPSGQMLIHEFPVQIVGQNSMKIILEPKCNRPFQALDNLFTKNYAPKSTNAILLHNCTSAVSPCNIPSIKVQTHFESLNCSNNSNLSCFSKEVTEDGFFDYSMAKSSRCQYLLSSISAESFTGSGVSLEIQMMELWWWLQGDCRCSKDAICTQVKSPVGSGFRCQCRDGLVGDGYLAGVGCRKGVQKKEHNQTKVKASAGCNSAKYLSGKCGGGSGVAVLLGGVVAGVGVSLGLFCCLIRRNSASDSWVAIKRIKHGDMDNIEQVMNEIKLISSHLQRERGDGLDWPVRLAIATDTAKAIAHLHFAMDPPIYHRDIKSSNILLDYHFSSKVADFGLSRHGMTEISHISTAPQGTPGYLDPQYHQNFHLSDKSDVYSFRCSADKISRGRLDEIIDPFLDLHSDAWTFSSVHKVAEVAFRCLAFHKDMRPSMVEVAAELEQIMLSRWASSEETNCPTSLDFSPCSSSSNVSEKPLNLTVRKTESERRGLFVLQTQPSGKSPEVANRNSPVSVQDPWLSEKSSPSSSNLLNNVIIK
ncbi:hypothetical protein OIU76_007546 [Salix suchowensis]|nr:hypothetical protein OIU76_007546 [Salix suchowensis]